MVYIYHCGGIYYAFGVKPAISSINKARAMEATCRSVCKKQREDGLLLNHTDVFFSFVGFFLNGTPLVTKWDSVIKSRFIFLPPLQ